MNKKDDKEGKRKSIVEYAKANGYSREAVAMNAILHGYTEAGIRNILHQEGVRRIEPRPLGQDSSFIILARYLRGDKQSDIARDLGCSRQHISAVLARAKRVGVFESLGR